MQGPVLQPFAYDEAHPYASGQHRGVDIGADSAGETVVAPAAGTVSFAGTVPTNGKSVTIETADGYSVTLTHLGSIGVVKGAAVAEQDAVGTVGPSGTPEVDGPYVHLGIRVTADPNGYVDPLGLLPPDPESSCDGERLERLAAELVVGRAREQTGACGAEEAAGGDLARIASCCTEPRPEPTHRSACKSRARRPGRAGRRTGLPCEIARASRRAPLGGRSSRRWRPGRSVSTPATSSGHPCPSRSPAASRRARCPSSCATERRLCSRLPWCSPRAGDGDARAQAPPRVRRFSSCRSRRWRTRAYHARRKPLRAGRMISGLPRASEGAVAGGGNAAEDPRRGRVALRERPAAPRPCRRPRRAVGRLRALSPAQGQRRPHGQRDGRARHAGDGLRRPRRRDPA